MILVTGGCGYIGSHIVKKLSEMGENVVVVDDLSHGRAEALLHNEILLRGDITDSIWLKSNLGNYQFDTIIHLAALVNAAESVAQPDLYDRINHQGTKNLLGIAQMLGVKAFLFASSAAVYGNPGTTGPIAEDTPLIPSNPYGQSKLDAEQTIIASGISYGIFRFFNVGGADESGLLYQSPDNNAIITRLLSAARDGSTITISGNDYSTQDGTVVRDFVHVNDIESAVISGILHLRKDSDPFVVNLGTGSTTSMQELLNICERVTGKTIKVIYGPRKEGDIVYSCADISRAHSVLGWSPTKTNMDIVKSAWSALNV